MLLRYMAIFARLVTLVLVGLAATAVFAAPAAAGGPTIPTPHFSADKVCTGSAEDNIIVTWTISTDSADLFDVTLTNAGPAGKNGVTPQSGEITAGQDLKLVETINPHVGGDAFIEVSIAPHGSTVGATTFRSQSFFSACGFTPAVSASAVCAADGTATIVWTVSNSS